MKETNINWNADYDVVVLGFGGAGGTAARFAADNGAKVLVVDAAPFGHEGGNTRYSAQHVAMATDRKKIGDYYAHLTEPLSINQKTLDTYLDGFVDMPDYFKKYFGIDAFVWSRDVKAGDKLDKKEHMAEYPEYEGSDTFDFALVHNQDFDAGLWKTIRKTVLDRSENIDVWLKSKACNLIQNNESGEVTGVVVERNHEKYYIHAKNGVVLATGGFENNHQMQQDYLHIHKLTPFGTLYNKGDGISMAQEVGSKMWHLGNYESLGVVPSYTFAEEDGVQGRQIGHWTKLYNGSIVAIADDGTRFMKEDAKFRHGHIYEHGEYILPHAYDNAWLVFDQKQYDKFVEEKKQNGQLRYIPFLDKTVSADSLAELATKVAVPAENLTKTIAQFNEFAKSGEDLAFDRAATSMDAFDNGKVYAIKLAPAVLNTQGGPERNENAEILSVNGEPISHLYGAGELGGICTNRYQGGGNLAECLIFGKIAGENAAKQKNDQSVEIEKPLQSINDLVDGERIDNIKLGPDQYVGTTEAGIGGKIVVRVTYKDEIIKNVEVLESHETEGIGAVAIKEMPSKFVEANTTDVDISSGASSTNRALKEAVENAIKSATK